MFLNETIRADFLIKRLNKKIEGNCLNKPPVTGGFQCTEL